MLETSDIQSTGTPPPNLPPFISLVSRSVSPPPQPQIKTCKRKKEIAIDQAFESISKRLNQIKDDDKFDIFGKYVANKLRALSDQQHIYAEKIINDTLFEMEINNLNKFCGLRIVTPLNYGNDQENNFQILQHPANEDIYPTQNEQNAKEIDTSVSTIITYSE